jgi:hypothetical protein
VGCKGHRNGTGNKKRPELAATAPPTVQVEMSAPLFVIRGAGV